MIVLVADGNALSILECRLAAAAAVVGDDRSACHTLTVNPSTNAHDETPKSHVLAVSDFAVPGDFNADRDPDRASSFVICRFQIQEMLMKAARWTILSTILLAVNAQSATAETSAKYRPVVVWHGMGDSCCNPRSMGAVSKAIEAELPGVYIYSIHVGITRADSRAGFFGNVNDQVDQVCQQLRQDPKLQGGFNAIGFSQVKIGLETLCLSFIGRTVFACVHSTMQQSTGASIDHIRESTCRCIRHPKLCQQE